MDLTPERLIEQSAAALEKGEWLQSLACSNLATAKLSVADTQPCGETRSWMGDKPEWACVLPANHADWHKDIEGDSWT